MACRDDIVKVESNRCGCKKENVRDSDYRHEDGTRINRTMECPRSIRMSQA